MMLKRRNEQEEYTYISAEVEKLKKLEKSLRGKDKEIIRQKIKQHKLWLDAIKPVEL